MTGDYPLQNDSGVDLPTSNNIDRELIKELDVYLNNSRWGVTLFAGHRDVLVQEIAKWVEADRNKLIKHLAFYYGLPEAEMKKVAEEV